MAAPTATHCRIASRLLRAPSPLEDMDVATQPVESGREGEWLSFGRADGLQPQCAGVAPYMDRHVGGPNIAIDFYCVDEVVNRYAGGDLARPRWS